jgi:type I restriction enzyme R subunit
MSTDPATPALPAELRARGEIDRQLKTAGWAVVDRKDLNPFVPSAVREVIMAPGHGRADYALYVDKEIVGVIEAKPEGTSLSGVEWQSAMYATGLPDGARARTHQGKLPFVFEANGIETHFTNGFDLPPSGDTCPLASGCRYRPRCPDVASEGHRDACPDGGGTAAGADPGRHWHRKVAG